MHSAQSCATSECALAAKSSSLSSACKENYFYFSRELGELFFPYFCRFYEFVQPLFSLCRRNGLRRSGKRGPLSWKHRAELEQIHPQRLQRTQQQGTNFTMNLSGVSEPRTRAASALRRPTHIGTEEDGFHRAGRSGPTTVKRAIALPFPTLWCAVDEKRGELVNKSWGQLLDLYLNPLDVAKC